ncbi:MAG: CPBP family intramembrane glutamic endopeptidase [Acidobacteriota bacterium]
MTQKPSECANGGVSLAVLSLLAALLFFPLFITRGIGAFDFWWWMASNNLLLVTLVIASSRDYRQALGADAGQGLLKKIALGLLAALALFVVFYIGNRVSRALFAFAGTGIDNVYGFKEGASTLRIGALIGFIIGPGEELFWRAFLQRALSQRYGPVRGYAVATAFYALVHVGSGNTMLVFAALVCGLFWGWLYLRFNSVVLTGVSHTTWDLVVFLALPFGA